MNSITRLTLSRACLRESINQQKIASTEAHRANILSSANILKTMSVLATCLTVFNTVRSGRLPRWLRRIIRSESASTGGMSGIRKPLLLVSIAAMAGAAIFWFRPWRSIAKVEKFAAAFVQPSIEVIARPSMKSLLLLVATALSFFKSKPDLQNP